MANHEPTRLCVGCRIRETTKNLVRVAFEDAGDSRSLVVDQRSVLPGRGAWLHRDPACLSAALRNRAFARAFRGPVVTEELEQVLATWQAENAHTQNNDESGSEI